MMAQAPTPAPARPAARSREDLDNERLKQEQALLDRGRSALVEERYESALDVVDEHMSQFPRGLLAPARERLRADACAPKPDDPRCHARR